MDADSQPTPDPEVAPLDCRSAGRALATLDRAPKDEVVRRAAEVRAHLDDCAKCEARHGARLRTVEGFLALRDRSLPDETFEDFYAGVRGRMPYAPPAGGMSAAFLDAPHALRLWRRTAVAAGFLLVLFGGYALSGGFGGEAPGATERRLHDPRENLLHAMDTELPTLQVRPLSPRRARGHEGFFDVDPGKDPSRVQAVGHGAVREQDAGWK
jgi:hypothetical protein